MRGHAIIVWFRQDLRLRDNPALAFARETGRPVVPVHVWSPEEEGVWPPGGASKWWLHHSLEALDASLRELGSRLIVRSGPALAVLRGLVAATGAESVVWNRRYEPAAIARDTALKQALLGDGLDARSFNGTLLFPPSPDRRSRHCAARGAGGVFELARGRGSRPVAATRDEDPCFRCDGFDRNGPRAVAGEGRARRAPAEPHRGRGWTDLSVGSRRARD